MRRSRATVYVQEVTVWFAAGLPAGGPPLIPSSISRVICRVVEISAYLAATIFSPQIIKCLNYSEAGRGVGVVSK